MKVVAASVAFAIGQIVLMLALVKILGTGPYSAYSLYFTLATAISALFSEWVRLLIARYSGVRGVRLRGAILTAALVWVGSGAFVTLAITAVATFVAFVVSAPTIARAIGSTGVLAASSMLGDSVATFMRFNRPSGDYLRYLAWRIGLSGTLMLCIGVLTRSADASALGFSMGVLLIATASIRLFWLPQAGRVSYRRLLRFVPVGWAMAMGTIGTNAILAIARVILKSVLPAQAAGAVFLALDLSTRGFNVLGVSFNTWAAKDLYSASHDRDRIEMEAIMSRTASLAMAMWLSLGIAGGAVAVAAPIILAGREAYGGFVGVAIANILAIMLLMVRIFSLDTMMNAVSRYRAVAIASMAVFLPLPVAVFYPTLAAYSLPAGVAVSYFIISVSAADMRVVRQSLIYVLILTATAGIVFSWTFSVALRPSLRSGLQGTGLALLDVALISVLLWRWRTGAMPRAVASDERCSG